MLANNDFEAALNLFNEMKDEGVNSDVQSYNTILSSASARVSSLVNCKLTESMTQFAKEFLNVYRIYCFGFY